MSVRLPYLLSAPLPSDPAGLVRRLNDLVKAQTMVHGYVRCERGASEAFLFVHEGKAHSGGELAEDRFVARTVGEFFESLREVKSATAFSTDLPLFLCTAVLFRKAPSAQVPLDLVDAETLLKAVEETGKDAVLVVRRNEARNLVFCRNGALAALYPADPTFPEDGGISDRILEYVFDKKIPGETTLDVYDEIRLPPAKDAGQPFEAYDATENAGPKEKDPILVVKLGGRIVFHFPVTEDEVRIGRGEPNDLPLDNLSVSRRHAILRRKGETLTVQDLESENGITLRGRRVKEAELEPGDEIRIGKYSIAYARWVTASPEKMPKPISSPFAALDATVATSSENVHAVIEHKSRRHPVKAVVFTIGSSPRAHLRIPGLFIAPVHAEIVLRPDGTHRIAHVAGKRRLVMNGDAVKTEALHHGDEFTIGRHRFRFRTIDVAGVEGDPPH